MPAADFAAYPARLDAAARRVDRDPTPAQRAAANYRHGVLRAHGLTVMIEVPAGGTRRGVGQDGRPWARRMQAHYGRIKGTVSADGEACDVFVGPDPDSQLVFVVSQLDADGNYDEPKALMGFKNVAAARAAYMAHYPADWAATRMGEVRGYTMAQFKQWLRTQAFKKKPASAVKAAAPADTREAVVAGFLAALAARGPAS